MTNQELQYRANYYAKTLWDMDLDIPVVFNGRFYQRMGCIHYKEKGKPEKIEIAKCLLDEYHNPYQLDDVLLHELIHWYCTKMGKQDWDGASDFENELKLHGVTSTRTCGRVGLFYTTKCYSCGKVTSRNRTHNQMKKYLNEDIYSSKCCNSKLVQGEIEVYRDDYVPSDKLVRLVQSYRDTQTCYIN